MEQNALVFSSFLNRLRLIGVHVTASPPAPEGSVWLFGKGMGILPFARGPMYPMQAREPGDLIPARMIGKILSHLDLTEEDQRQFWSIQEHALPAAVQPSSHC
jgi:hypothetical protein